ncbi:MAG: hypothetical protein H0T42_10080 [Deltaproteobacteria bacterium]|nr:hypothetical protein [Deltaproteobacteria bacterium]
MAKFDEILVELDALATKMCGCHERDSDCMVKVQSELLAFRKGLRERVGKDKASADQEKRGREAEERLRACRARAAGDGFDEVVTRLTDYKAQACACTDKACADQVREGWKAYRATIKERLGSAALPTLDQDARGMVIDTELKTCLDKFEASAAPPS